MKKILLILVILLQLNAVTAYALGEMNENPSGGEPDEGSNPISTGSDESAGTDTGTGASAPTSDDLFKELLPTQDELFTDTTRLEDEEKVSFAEGDLEQEIAPKVLKLLISLSAIGAFIIFTYLGIRVVFARTNEEELKKAKDSIISATVGAAIIAGSFAVVIGVLRIFNAI